MFWLQQKSCLRNQGNFYIHQLSSLKRTKNVCLRTSRSFFFVLVHPFSHCFYTLQTKFGGYIVMSVHLFIHLSVPTSNSIILLNSWTEFSENSQAYHHSTRPLPKWFVGNIDFAITTYWAGVSFAEHCSQYFLCYIMREILRISDGHCEPSQFESGYWVLLIIHIKYVFVQGSRRCAIIVMYHV